MMKTQKTTNVKAWGGRAKAYAEADGSVKVWDSVAGHYTRCHSLTAAQVRRVVRLTKGKTE